MKQNKKLTFLGKATIISFLLGIVSFLIKAMTEKNNFIDNKGILHEPNFFLLPLGYLGLILAIFCFLIAIIIKLKNKK